MAVSVLVVEDDQITQVMMHDMFDALGYEVSFASRGRDCLKALDQSPSAYDIILMDLHMPGMSGIEATSQIRSARDDPPKGIPILAVTADEDWHNEERCVKAGFNGVIPKPVSLSKLRDGIEAFAA